VPETLVSDLPGSHFWTASRRRLSNCPPPVAFVADAGSAGNPVWEKSQRPRGRFHCD